jgi:hypothetical protein
MRQKTLYYMYSIEYTFSHLEPVASLMALRKITESGGKADARRPRDSLRRLRRHLHHCHSNE